MPLQSHSAWFVARNILGVLAVIAIAACTAGEKPAVAQRQQQSAPAPRIAQSVGQTAPAGPQAAAGEPARYAGIVDGHNQARRAVGVPDLQWSSQLAEVAQRWADTLRGESCKMRHTQQRGVSENLHRIWGGRDTPTSAIAGWLAERQHFDATTKTCAPGKVCGHYTQMVWRSTRFVGCGMTACGDGELWVCNYEPVGNFVGQAPF